MQRLLALAALSIAAAPAALAQTLTVAAGDTPTDLSVRSYGPSGLVAQGPSGIALLDVELAGRSARERFDAARAQRVALPGVPVHVVLPGGDRLFRFRRTALGIHGFLLVRGTGAIDTLLEMAEAAGLSPFLPAVAVSPDGSVIAVATTLAAGGDVFHLAATTGTSTLLTPGSPVSIDDGSLAFAQGALFATAGEVQLLRASLPAGILAPVALPASGGVTPPFVHPEIAVSRDGSTIAFLAGAEPKVTDLYVGRADGTVWNRTKSPGRHEQPGYGADEPLGPMLALSDDGALVAYLRRVDEKELFVALSGPSAVGLGSQLTGNAVFQESIGTGITIGFWIGRLTFGFGGTVDTFDLFGADATAGPPTPGALTNLTLTGSVAAPFQDVATIVPADVARLPGSGALFVVDAGTSPGARIGDPAQPAAGLASSTPLLLSGASSAGYLPWVAPSAGGAHALLVARVLPNGTAATQALSFPASVTPTRLAVSPSGARALVVTRSAGGAETAHSVSLRNGAHLVTRLPSGWSAESAEVDAAGRMRFALRGPLGTQGRLLAPKGRVLAATPIERVLFLLK